ncbi:polyprenyl synthetase family protein [candidate division KSB1 bacterium]|nr:polyprenyl synthetase family protein [candidate division KSB1 bacterium]
MTLQTICEPIKSDLQNFEIEFKAILKSDVLLLNYIIEHITRLKGKRLRPMLVFLTARMVGDASAQTMKAAILIELLHTATLLHDDVVDESDTRRGEPTVNSIWENKVAILSGDYLLAKVFQFLLEFEETQIFKILAQVTQRMSQGELLQIERKKDYFMDESIYYRLVSDKTASLIAAACQLGGLSARSNGATDFSQSLGQLGESLGIAFQIKDDLLDYVGDSAKTGKPVGNDIMENKITLPLLHALKHTPAGEAEKIIRMIENGVHPSQLQTIQNFVIENAGIAYAEREAERYLQQAFTVLEQFPGSPYRQALQELIHFVVQREK